MVSVVPSTLGLPEEFELPERPWKIGIVGFGRHAQRAHAPDYLLAGWKLAAVSSRSEVNRHAAEKEFNVRRVYANFQELLADEEVEVVSLLAQPELREEVVMAAIAARKPVIVEKPAALTLAECERMATASSESGIAVGVHLNYRWMPGNFLAKAIIDCGLLGKIYYVSIENFGRQDSLLAGHSYYANCQHFLPLHWGVHFTDLIQQWMNVIPSRVSVRTSRKRDQNFKSDNLATASFDFGEFATAVVAQNQLVSSSPPGNRCRIDGESGSLLFDFAGKEMILYNVAYPGGLQLDPSGCRFFESICGSMGEFLASLGDHKESTVSIQKHLPVMRVVEAQTKSAQLGEWQAC